MKEQFLKGSKINLLINQILCSITCMQSMQQNEDVGLKIGLMTKRISFQTQVVTEKRKVVISGGERITKLNRPRTNDKFIG